MSCVRPERIGPTTPGSVELNTAANLVAPPSTISSKTMSASLRPDCGSASTLSTLTTSAGRGTTTPVNGRNGCVVVVVGAVVVDCADVVGAAPLSDGAVDPVVVVDVVVAVVVVVSIDVVVVVFGSNPTPASVTAKSSPSD